MELSFSDFKQEKERLLYDGKKPITSFSSLINDFGNHFYFKNTKFIGNFDANFISKLVTFKNCTFEGEINFCGDNNRVKIDGEFPNVKVNEPNSDFFFTINSKNKEFVIENYHLNKLTVYLFLTSIIIVKNINSKEVKITSMGLVNPSLKIFIDTPLIDIFEISYIVISDIQYNNSKFTQFKFIQCIIPENIEEFYFIIPNTKLLIINGLKSALKKIDFSIGDFDDPLLTHIELVGIECNFLYLEMLRGYMYLENLVFSSNCELIINKFESPLKMVIENLALEGKFTRPLLIEDISIKNLKFYKFETLNDVTFNNIEILNAGELFVTFSDLNMVTFKPSILHKFKRINILESDFQGFKLIGFKFVKESVFAESFIDNNKILITTDNKKIFRHLKSKSLLEGDLDSYQKYKAYEFNEMLRNGQNLKKGEKIILNFNKYTNYHSTDWTKAVKLLLIFFFLYLSLILTYLYCSYSSFEFLQASKILLYLVSPVNLLMHYDDFEFPNEIYIIDFFYNIAIGLILYQMIAAFRKFNR